MTGRKLANERLAAGAYQLEWRGTDDSGNIVAGGVYLVRLSVGRKILVNRMLLLK
jgi:hypothetical protein